MIPASLGPIISSLLSSTIYGFGGCWKAGSQRLHPMLAAKRWRRGRAYKSLSTSALFSHGTSLERFLWLWAAPCAESKQPQAPGFPYQKSYFRPRKRSIFCCSISQWVHSASWNLFFWVESCGKNVQVPPPQLCSFITAQSKHRGANSLPFSC